MIARRGAVFIAVNRALLAGMMAAVALGCGDGDSSVGTGGSGNVDAGAGIDAGGTEDAKTTQADDSGQASVSGIEALQIDGVWVFQYTSIWYGDGLFSGTAEIVDDCLVVGDYVVIWDASRLAYARALISAVQAGEKPKVEMGGGEYNNEQRLATVSEHCPATAVWLGGYHEVVIYGPYDDAGF